jgi:glycosyltransferase involved in cell wall biosynthesis
MFRLDSPIVTSRKLWEIPFATRLQSLDTADVKVAIYYGLMPDNGTFRYRVYNMVQTLNSSDRGVSATFFYLSELDRLSDIVDKIDVLVICRGKYCDRLGHVIAVARNKGKKVIFDIDDLMFDPRYMHLVLKSADADYSRFTRDEVWQYWYGDCARYAATMSLCDKVLATNNYLAERIREYSGKQVSVIPNYLNQEQLDVSTRLYEQKLASDFSRTEPLYLGYFSGSHTHNHDFRILTDTLIALFEKYDNLKLRIIGLLNLDDRLKVWSDRIEQLPIQDYLNLQKSIGEVEINLVPLQINTFTNCKSELKYFESAITGTISIASPTFVYANAIVDGQNGFLAQSYEWFEKIDSVLSSMNEYPVRAKQAFQHAEQNYSWKNLIGMVEKNYLD